MEQKDLSIWLKGILAGVAVCAFVVYFFIIPTYGKSVVESNPEFAFCYWPWLIFLWMTAVPCYLAFVFGWKIASNIGLDKSFSYENANYLKWIAWLAAGDAGFFFLGNVIMLFLSMNHPGILLFSLLIVFAGIAIAVAAAALSHLVQKAAALQEQSDLTI